MKKVIISLICSFCLVSGIAQSDSNGITNIIPERTPELNALYQEAKVLEQNGTSAEINANRLAIKNAWQKIDPKVAELYKPLPEIDQSYGPAGPGVSIPGETIERPKQDPIMVPEWSTDVLIREGFVDGLDMTTAQNGDLYIGMYISVTGGTSHTVYIYRSTDNGVSWSLFAEREVSTNIALKKIQLVPMDGTGGGSDHYIMAYVLFENGQFTALRWNMSDATYSFDTIVADIKDFSVDTNYPGVSSQRVFATYIKNNNRVYSARSTSGSYGFDWVDETSLGILGEQVAFAYGLNGSSYTTFLGFNSKSLRANVNDSYNDPASWGANETITDGSAVEVKNPTIRAGRFEIATDKVIIWASTRTAGTTDEYDGVGYLRENGGPYTIFSNFASGSGYSIVHTDSWIRRNASNPEIIQTSYVRERVDNSSNNQNRSLTFNGSGFDPFEPVADDGIDVYNGFATAVAETNDGNPCLAFAGSILSGTYGYNLYFDSANFIAGTKENNFEGFALYPNPTKDVLNLSAKSNVETASIYTLLGQRVMEVSPNNRKASLNVASLTPGVYIVKIAINNQTASYKFIKE